MTLNCIEKKTVDSGQTVTDDFNIIHYSAFCNSATQSWPKSTYSDL